VIFGIGAAFAWGLADVGAAVVGRRIGSLAALVLAQIVSAVLIGTWYLVERPAWTGTPGDVGLLALNGAVAAIAYVLLYRGLELGPIALVSPIVAAYAVPAIALAVLLLDESLGGLVLAGIVVTLLGVVLTSTDLRQVGDERMSRAGVPVALVSMLLFGLATYVLGLEAKQLGWLTAVVIGRGFSVTGLLLLAAVRRPKLLADGAKGIGGAALIGVADIAGVAFYSIGSERGLISIVTAASATFILIPVAAGILWLDERPAVIQLVGVALVVGGLLLLGLG
jgi:drug/metabolite transporter (DMT)-like permease